MPLIDHPFFRACLATAIGVVLVQFQLFPLIELEWVPEKLNDIFLKSLSFSMIYALILIFLWIKYLYFSTTPNATIYILYRERVIFTFYYSYQALWMALGNMAMNANPTILNPYFYNYLAPLMIAANMMISIVTIIHALTFGFFSCLTEIMIICSPEMTLIDQFILVYHTYYAYLTDTIYLYFFKTFIHVWIHYLQYNLIYIYKAQKIWNDTGQFPWPSPFY